MHARDLILWLQNEFPELAMRAIRNGNGTEFMNTYFETFCTSLGLEHQFSSRYVPRHNCVVEHKNAPLVETARMMLNKHMTSSSIGSKLSTQLAMCQTTLFFELS